MLRLLDRFRPAPAQANILGPTPDLSDLLRNTAAHEVTAADLASLGADEELARIAALARDLER